MNEHDRIEYARKSIIDESQSQKGPLDDEARSLSKLAGALVILAGQTPFRHKEVQGKGLVKNYLDN